MHDCDTPHRRAKRLWLLMPRHCIKWFKRSARVINGMYDYSSLTTRVNQSGNGRIKARFFHARLGSNVSSPRHRHELRLLLRAFTQFVRIGGGVSMARPHYAGTEQA